MTREGNVTELRERLVAMGHSVIAVRTGEKAPFEAGWRSTSGVPVFSDAAANTGIRCDRLRAVDLDVDDPSRVADVETLVAEHFGADAPIRFRSNSPRTLRAYRSDRPRSKRIVELPFGKVEILGAGQQFVAFGEHPTGALYQWRGGALDTIPFDALPAVTEEAEEAFARACAVRWPMPKKSPAAAAPRPTGRIELHTCIPADVEAALAALPNDYESRDDWIRFGLSAFAGGAQFESFDAWSQKWSGYDPDHTRATWDSFSSTGVHSITAATLFGEVFRRVPGWRKPSELLGTGPIFGSEFGSSDARSLTDPGFGSSGSSDDSARSRDDPEFRSNGAGDDRAADGEDDPTVGWDKVEEPDPLPIGPRVLPPAEAIKPRRWLYGKAHLRQCVGAIVAPGGWSKSMIAMVETMALATGRRLLHDRPVRPFKAFYWNLEDPIDELERRFAAIVQHHGIAPDDYAGRLFFESGHNLPLKLAETYDDRRGFRLDEDSLARLERTIAEHGLDCIFIDPIISAHGVPENDNNAVDMVIKALAAIATRTDCAITLVHHARKSLAGPARELDAGDARGAAAFVDGCRIVRLVQRMTPDDAKNFGVEPDQRWRHLRLVDGKTNHAPPAEVSAWIKLESVPLNNPDPDNPDGDHIGVPIRWEALPADKTIPAALLKEIQATVRAGDYRANSQADHWVGYVLGPLFNLDPESPAQKRLIVNHVRRLVHAGHLQEINRQDKNHEWRNYIVVPEQSSSTRGAGEVLEGAG